MRLTRCLEKAGSFISAHDRATIEKLATDFRRSGMADNAAAATAIRAQLRAVTGEIRQMQSRAAPVAAPATVIVRPAPAPMQDFEFTSTHPDGRPATIYMRRLSPNDGAFEITSTNADGSTRVSHVRPVPPKGTDPSPAHGVEAAPADFQRAGMSDNDAAAAPVRPQVDTIAGESVPLATAPRATSASLDQQLAARAVEQPDMPVVLPGVEGQMRLADAMNHIAETRKQDGHWASLLRVAADCALSLG